jgi:hypothetical protein
MLGNLSGLAFSGACDKETFKRPPAAPWYQGFCHTYQFDHHYRTQ